METGYIKITGTSINVKLVEGTVWMTVNEIADLFGVNISTVNKYLKGIFKDNLLRELEVVKEYRYTHLKYGECIRIYYNLDVITYLCFRIQSLYAKAFREWIFHSLYKKIQVGNFNNGFISCDSIIKEYSLLNLN